MLQELRMVRKAARLTRKTRLIVQFGAILTLVVIGLDPFAQQLIQLDQDTRYDQPTNDTFAHISRSTNYSLGTSKAHHSGFTNTSIDLETNTTTILSDSEWWNVTTSIPMSMEGAIMAAFYRSTEELQRETLFQCSSGNCTFDEFQTLGICHRCSDVTSKLVHRTGDFEEFVNAVREYRSPGGKGGRANAFHLPNGHLIANTNGCRPYTDGSRCWGERLISTSFGTGNPNKTVSMQDIDTILWSMSFIYPDIEALENSGSFPEPVGHSEGDNITAVSWPTIKLGATECAIYYCLKNITSTVKDSKLTENITEINGVTRFPGSWDEVGSSYMDEGIIFNNEQKPPEYHAPADEARSLEFHKMWSVLRYKSLGLIDPSRGSFRSAQIQENSIKSLSARFQELFRWEDWFNNTGIRQSLQNIPGMEDAVGFNGAITGWVTEVEYRPPMLGQLIPRARTNHGNIASTFERLAFSMTNEIRRSSQPEDQARNGIDTMTYEGLLGTPVVLYRVVWPWIVLHVTSLVCACIFLLMTVYSSDSKDDTPLWKSSSLGAIRRGHDIGGLLDSVGPSVSEMEDVARKTYVSEARKDLEEARPWIAEAIEPAVKPREQSRSF